MQLKTSGSLSGSIKHPALRSQSAFEFDTMTDQTEAAGRKPTTGRLLQNGSGARRQS